MLFDLPLMKL